MSFSSHKHGVEILSERFQPQFEFTINLFKIKFFRYILLLCNRTASTVKNIPVSYHHLFFLIKKWVGVHFDGCTLQFLRKKFKLFIIESKPIHTVLKQVIPHDNDVHYCLQLPKKGILSIRIKNSVFQERECFIIETLFFDEFLLN